MLWVYLLLQLLLPLTKAQPPCQPTGESLPCTRIFAIDQLPYQFVDQLPRFTPLLFEDCTANHPASLTLTMREGSAELGIRVNDSKVETTIWTYALGKAIPTAVYGPHVIVPRFCTLAINWLNELPSEHQLWIDETVDCGPNAEGCRSELGQQSRTSVHIHGGYQSWENDGHALDWYTNELADGNQGTLFTSGTSKVYYNTQESATLFYHDHAMGITRLNVYMGLAGAYTILDETKSKLETDFALPPLEPLVIRDVKYQLSPSGRAELYYETGTVDDEGRALPPYSIVAEQFGDFIAVNGANWPVLEGVNRVYRFLLLNSCDSRFLDLQFRLERTGTLLPFQVIASEQGLLQRSPQVLALRLGPADRYEVLLDLTQLTIFDQVTLENTADTLQGPVNPLTEGRVLRIFLTDSDSEAEPLLMLPQTSLRLFPFVPSLQSTVVAPPVRRLILSERLQVLSRAYPGVRPQPLLGVLDDEGQPIELQYFDPTTEKPVAGTTEVWELYNISPDDHPIHLHLVAFRILNRQAFFLGSHGVVLNGPVLEPPPYELGPKDMVIVPAGQVARLLVRWTLPAAAPAEIGHYLWHCHILSHEDNEMMRPLEVQPAVHVDRLQRPALPFAHPVRNFPEHPSHPLYLSLEPSLLLFSFKAPQSGYLFQQSRLALKPFTTFSAKYENPLVLSLSVVLSPIEEHAAPSSWIISQESIVWELTSWKRGHTVYSPDFTPLLQEALDYRRSQKSDLLSDFSESCSAEGALESYGILVQWLEGCSGEGDAESGRDQVLLAYGACEEEDEKEYGKAGNSWGSRGKGKGKSKGKGKGKGKGKDEAARACEPPLVYLEVVGPSKYRRGGESGSMDEAGKKGEGGSYSRLEVETHDSEPAAEAGVDQAPVRLHGAVERVLPSSSLQLALLCTVFSILFCCFFSFLCHRWFATASPVHPTETLKGSSSGKEQGRDESAHGSFKEEEEESTESKEEGERGGKLPKLVLMTD